MPRIDRPTRGLNGALFAALVLLCTSVPAWAHDKEGFLYGTVTTDKGQSYSGVLRWDDEESFWDDLFNSAKTDLPFAEDRAEEEDGGKKLKILGREINIRWGNYSSGRQFVTRFGDIDRIEVRGQSKATLLMRDGTELAVEGSANDVEATISIVDGTVGVVEVPWRRIEMIQFAPTPADAKTLGYRIRGKVKTTEGDFEGYIQWDSEEALSIDKIDGDEDDVRMSIDMGKIRKIERESRRRSKLTLKDGRSMILDGTNDVNEEIRGVLVEDERFGRVTIDWDAFEEVEFLDEGPSGRGYESYAMGGRITGKVTTSDGEVYRGQIAYDLDEAYFWEMLDGEANDISYSIPFSLITTIRPRGDDYAEVTVKAGDTLRLEDTQDVTDANDGLLIEPASGEAIHVKWEDIELIELD